MSSELGNTDITSSTGDTIFSHDSIEGGQSGHQESEYREAEFKDSEHKSPDLNVKY